MAVNLTAGAITKILNGEVTNEKEMMPVLQVTELKMIQSKLHQNQESSNRYKVTLSDGILLLQGMLKTSLNNLVLQGNIQVGSIIRLTQYVCNLIQNRRIDVIVELEIILEKCDIIGTHVQVGQSSIDQQRGGTVPVNTQSIGGFEQQQGRRSDVNGEEGSQASSTNVDDHQIRPKGIKVAKARRNNAQGKALAEYKSMWEIKKEELAQKAKLSKLAILDTLLAKKEPLSEAEEVVKNKLLAQYF